MCNFADTLATIFLPPDETFSTETPGGRGRGAGPLTSTAVKRRRAGEPDTESGESEQGTEAGSEKGSERDFEQ